MTAQDFKFKPIFLPYVPKKWQYGIKDTGSHMKTTLDLNDEVLERAKGLAARENRTLRAIVEDALRLYLDRIGSDARSRPQLSIQPWGQGGFLPEYRDKPWSEILGEVNERPSPGEDPE
ncbi:MAG TPA: hypothetical protein VKA18_13300 [Alphaproteobacteria bacterium]|nr:hypothetical protein [Alphaproteobacteria bacterium]